MNAWEERIAELEFENASLRHELNVVEKDLDNISTELKEYHDFLDGLIDSIKKELKQSSATEYICNDGTVIHTDVGYVEDWFNKYEQVLRRRMENKHDGT